MGHLFLFIFKEKNDNHLILASAKKKDEATFCSSLKKTDEGHLKQMKEDLRCN